MTGLALTIALLFAVPAHHASPVHPYPGYWVCVPLAPRLAHPRSTPCHWLREIVYLPEG